MRVAFAVATAVLLLACGGASGPSDAPPPSKAPHTPRPVQRDRAALDELVELPDAVTDVWFSTSQLGSSGGMLPGGSDLSVSGFLVVDPARWAEIDAAWGPPRAWRRPIPFHAEFIGRSYPESVREAIKPSPDGKGWLVIDPRSYDADPGRGAYRCTTLRRLGDVGIEFSCMTM